MFRKIIAATALIAVTGLVAATAYVFGTDTPTRGASIVASAPSGPSQGIAVQGHWTIEIAEPDGTVVSTNEFENSLTVNGAQFLSDVLSRESTPGIWKVVLATQSGVPGACLTTSGNAVGCTITELPVSDPSLQSATTRFGGLSVTSPSSGANERALVLSGSATATNDGTIGRVSTTAHACSSATAPDSASTCSTNNTVFTVKVLSIPIVVLTGQSINTTVVISFN
jgi:hypothetical protein